MSDLLDNGVDLPERFPGLDDPGPDGLLAVHADAPGGTHVTESVIAAMAAYQRHGNANPNRVYPASVGSADMLATTRGAFGRFVDADPAGVVFGPNATTLTWRFARALEARLRPGDGIVCTQLDHEANVAPWLAVAERTGAEVRFVTLDPETFELDLSSLERAVDGRTRVIAFTRVSNLLGTVVPAAPFVEAARSCGAVTYADAVAAAAHFPLRQRAEGIDVQVCSAYKFFGPHMGVMSARPELLDALSPDRVRPAPTSGPRRWEAGMPPLEAVAGLAAALHYLDRLGFDRIAQLERVLTEQALERLAELPRIRLFGKRTAAGREPTFALRVDGVSPAEVATQLAAEGVYVSSGTNYAIETLNALGLSTTEGVVRAGFVHYHRPAEVDRTLAALGRIAEGS
ncbi:aminotransferase class V-fold PLP-dependent enzyme [Micromonospora andamanensis]|uniref:Cysteine desulfurase-like protein n=1 Tax=Micromonospora andamanensis TaxID=1287068 RepID=A0ABQ4I3P5_9ACTN|nr:aminotransferase class V-fold PLP-dependent enzyme [Micromonospora andamanensis]GIJ12512.1 cysteine desulfurase-like protein [Micromonospora andamanensis]GIJ42003.1 cysteine desulfurase-like protein [Micromonospora andamanensis]